MNLFGVWGKLDSALEVAIEASATGTQSLTAVNELVSDIEPYSMSGAVSGTYMTGSQSDDFSSRLNAWNASDVLKQRLAFTNYPNSVELRNASVRAEYNLIFFATETPVVIDTDGRLMYVSVRLPGPVTLLAQSVHADFDDDGDTDGADFLTWQRELGNQYGSDELAVWKSNFGTRPNALSVPEPTAAVIVFIALVSLCCRSLISTSGERSR